MEAPVRSLSPRRLLVLAALVCGSPAASGESVCGPDGLQGSGSIYRICMPAPAEYNGRLVIWAHGYQDAGTPVGIPEDQLSFGGISIPEIVNTLGFGFATNSYSKTGLAIRQGTADILDLVEIYSAEQGAPESVYVVGASEGGIITALLVEQHPGLFRAGVAACGPVGDFRFQINYFGDARATFQYFFPSVIPGDPFAPPQDLVENWFDYYDSVVKPIVFDPSNRDRLDQWVAVAKLPFDSGDYLGTVEQSVHDVLRYSVVNVSDATETLGGLPFGNSSRWYSGSSNDLLLNWLVPRRSADPAAVAEMDAFYDTSGELVSPLITLHTRRDPQIPYAHELLYALKTLASGSFVARHANVPVDRFGHCEFTAGEALFSFALMLAYAGDLDLLAGVGSVLEGENLAAFERLAERHGIRYRVGGASLRVIRGE